MWLEHSASFITATPLGNLKGRIENKTILYGAQCFSITRGKELAVYLMQGCLYLLQAAFTHKVIADRLHKDSRNP